MKNYKYVFDLATPLIKKLYDKEDDYKVEFLTPYGVLEELEKLREENNSLEAKLAESQKEVENWKDGTIVIKLVRLEQQLAEWERDSNVTLNEYRAIKHENKQLNKALELACEDKPRPIKYYGNYMGSVNDYIEFYKTKAKEMMKSE